MHNEFDRKIDCDAFIIFVLSAKEKVSGIHESNLWKLLHVRASESHLLHFSRGIFEEISLILSCTELNDVSFEIRLKSLKWELIETFEGRSDSFQLVHPLVSRTVTKLVTKQEIEE